MAQDYIVAKVDDEIKRWASRFGDMVTYTLLLEETGEEIVQQNKKPDSPAPKVGDTIYGNIERNAFGAKFKAEQRQEAASSSGSKPAWQPKDERQITRNMVWKNLLGHYDVQSMEPDSDQWKHFWAGVDLHTEMLLPQNSGSGGAVNSPSTIKEPMAAAESSIKTKLASSDWVPEDDEIH